MFDLPPSLKMNNRKIHLQILSQPKTKCLVSLQLINKVQLLLLVWQGRTLENNISSFSFSSVFCEIRFPCIFASYKNKFRSTLAHFSQNCRELKLLICPAWGTFSWLSSFVGHHYPIIAYKGGKR